MTEHLVNKKQGVFLLLKILATEQENRKGFTMGLWRLFFYTIPC